MTEANRKAEIARRIMRNARRNLAARRQKAFQNRNRKITQRGQLKAYWQAHRSDIHINFLFYAHRIGD